MTFLDLDEDQPRGPQKSHWRRFGAIYAIVLVVVLVAAGFAIVKANDNGSGSATKTASAATAPAGRSGPWKPGSGTLVHGTGTTRDGRSCGTGTLQVAGNSYSVPCLPQFTGDNGGATSDGVDKDTIRIVMRDFPADANLQSADQSNREAGFATPQQTKDALKEWFDYFDQHYELYGRKVELITYVSQFGNPTTEALGGGREGACADATKIKQELHAYGVFSAPVLLNDAGATSSPFTDCARQQGLVVFDGNPYYSETYMRKQDPYAWGIATDCERVSNQVASYIGNRLLNRPATYAKGDLKNKTRVIGTYVADDPEYTRCVKQTVDRLTKQYGEEKHLEIAYQLDLSRFAEQAQRAILQFKQEGMTTIVLACDPISLIYLTNAAKAQNYYPEWFTIGTAGDDTDNFGRQYEQSEVSGSLFGLSQLGSTDKLLGSNAESRKLYRTATGKELPKGTTGMMYTATHIFNMLEAAGPDLTPANMAKGAVRIPVRGAPGFAFGSWSFLTNPDGTPGSDHTEIDDSREVYWDANAISPSDGKKGTYVETNGGKRYDSSEWPKRPPDVYPKGAASETTTTAG